jgi:hypothetical protein
MTYVTARRSLMQHGFVPVAVQHDPENVQLGAGSAFGRAFPEAINCEGTGAGACQFLFRDHATGAYLVVQTAGEDGDDAPGTGIGVTALYAGQVKPGASTPLTADDVTNGESNILAAFAPWKPDDKAIDELRQGPDRLFAAVGTDADPFVPFDGAGFLKRFEQSGYAVHGFSRDVGDDVRIDLTRGAQTIRVYVTRSADYNVGVATISKVEVSGKSYENGALRTWLDSQAAQ